MRICYEHDQTVLATGYANADAARYAQQAPVTLLDSENDVLVTTASSAMERELPWLELAQVRGCQR